MWKEGEYFNGIHPFGSFIGRELPPFTPNLGVLTRIFESGGGSEETEKQGVNNTRERSHLWRTVNGGRAGRNEDALAYLLYVSQ